MDWFGLRSFQGSSQILNQRGRHQNQRGHCYQTDLWAFECSAGYQMDLLQKDSCFPMPMSVRKSIKALVRGRHEMCIIW